MIVLIKFDVLFDLICFWCYIGKIYLDWVFVVEEDYLFVIEWYLFQLNFDMFEDGMDCCEYFECKFGGKDGVICVYGYIV